MCPVRSSSIRPAGIGSVEAIRLRVGRRRQPVAVAGDHERRDGQPRDRRIQVHVRERDPDGRSHVRRALDQHPLVERHLAVRRGRAERDEADRRVRKRR